jgi:hypothetical protein
VLDHCHEHDEFRGMLCERHNAWMRSFDMYAHNDGWVIRNMRADPQSFPPSIRRLLDADCLEYFERCTDCEIDLVLWSVK